MPPSIAAKPPLGRWSWPTGDCDASVRWARRSENRGAARRCRRGRSEARLDGIEEGQADRSDLDRVLAPEDGAPGHRAVHLHPVPEGEVPRLEPALAPEDEDVLLRAPGREPEVAERGPPHQRAADPQVVGAAGAGDLPLDPRLPLGRDRLLEPLQV